MLVAQTRSACANEVRKRDRQIDGLKKAVSEAGRARGSTKNPGITTISVTGEIAGDRDQGTPRGDTDNDGYDLRMETNAFLAELAKGLSEENETLLSLLRKMNQRLKEMSGWDKEDGARATTDGHAVSLPGNPEEMADEIDSVLDHLRTILTNPSFVPIEEVVMREEEISRLRDGWEKMESRWKEAVHLIDGWRRRMQIDGRPVNMEELKMGLRLSPVRVKDVEETSMGLGLRLPAVQEEVEESSILQSPCPLADSLHLVPAPEYEEPDMSDMESSVFEDDVDIDQFDVEEPNVQILQQSVMFDSPPLPSPPQLSPLRDSYTAANRGAATQPKKNRAGDFTTIVEENAWDMLAEAAPDATQQSAKPLTSAARKPARSTKPAATEDEMPPPPLPADTSASNSASPETIMLVKPAASSAPKPPPTSTTRSQPRPMSRQQNRSEPTPTLAARRPVRPPIRPAAIRNRQAPNADNEQATQPVTTTTAKPTRTASSSSTATTSSSTSTSTTLTSNTATTNNNSSGRSTDMPPPASSSSSSSNRSPRRANSRLPLPRTAGAALLPAPQQSPLTMATISAKLAASEREADAARVRAKLRAARLGRQPPPASAGLAAPGTAASGSSSAGSTSVASESVEAGRGDEESLEPVKRDFDHPAVGAKEDVVAAGESGSGADGDLRPVDAQDEGNGEGAAVELVLEKPRKRDRRVNKVASRRRSTLNQWELESLIMGSVGVEATPAR